MKHSPFVVPGSKTGFGFDQIMRNPDYGRFPAWYAKSSCLTPGPQSGTAGTASSVVPGSKAGFGFDGIMRNPDYTRFPAWYARCSHLAAGHQAAAEPAEIVAAPHFELDQAA